MLALLLALFAESVGYVGRIIMHSNPWSQTGFKIQICCLVLGPSFLAAGIYLTLKHLVLYYGPEHSRFKPRLYPWLFIGCDFGSIVLQAIGGGVAASAGDTGNRKLLNAGNGIIVAGIAFQVATMAVCALVVLDYFFRYRKGKQTSSVTPAASAASSEEEKTVLGETPRTTTTKLRLFVIMMMIAFVAIFIRCIYR